MAIDYTKTVVPEVLADSLVQELRDKIIQLAYDEILLAPSTNEFSEKKLGLTFAGKLVLTNGKFRGLQTLKRVGGVTVGFNEYTEMTFTIELRLTSPETTHDFLLIFLKRELEGQVISKMTYTNFTMTIGLNLLTRRLRLIQFKFKELGEVDAEISRLGTLMDYVASKVTQVAMNRVKWEVANDVETEMMEKFAEIINGTVWPSRESPGIVVSQIRRRTLEN